MVFSAFKRYSNFEFQIEKDFGVEETRTRKTTGSTPINSSSPVVWRAPVAPDARYVPYTFTIFPCALSLRTNGAGLPTYPYIPKHLPTYLRRSTYNAKWKQYVKMAVRAWVARKTSTYMDK